MQMCNTWSHARTHAKVTPMTHATVKMPLNVFKMTPSPISIATPGIHLFNMQQLGSFRAYQRTKSANSRQRNIFIKGPAQQVIHRVTHSTVNPCSEKKSGESAAARALCVRQEVFPSALCLFFQPGPRQTERHYAYRAALWQSIKCCHCTGSLGGTQ